MGSWSPRDEMGVWAYLKFKAGRWVSVGTIPQWVHNASDPPPKTDIPISRSVEKVFTGDNLQYRVRTKRLPRGSETYTDQEYFVRIKR